MTENFKIMVGQKVHPEGQHFDRVQGPRLDTGATCFAITLKEGRTLINLSLL